jgi:hypothetical protein
MGTILLLDKFEHVHIRNSKVDQIQLLSRVTQMSTTITTGSFTSNIALLKSKAAILPSVSTLVSSAVLTNNNVVNTGIIKILPFPIIKNVAPAWLYSAYYLSIRGRYTVPNIGQVNNDGRKLTTDVFYYGNVAYVVGSAVDPYSKGGLTQLFVRG